MLRKFWHFLLKATVVFVLASVLSVIFFRFVPVPVTMLMLERCVQQKLAGKPIHLKKEWVPLERISNSMQLAVFASEDQHFLWHHGFDFGAIEKAMDYNEKQEARKHPRIRGASTISQQCAKNTFLFPNRNFIRKGLEVYFTALIELFWSKQRIMEVYLNVIETGDGIYGVEAAAKTYFNTHAANLTPAQSALIAGCLPEPLKLNPAKPSAYLLKRQEFIRYQMELWGDKLDYHMKEPEVKTSERQK